MTFNQTIVPEGFHLEALTGKCVFCKGGYKVSRTMHGIACGCGAVLKGSNAAQRWNKAWDEISSSKGAMSGLEALQLSKEV